MKYFFDTEFHEYVVNPAIGKPIPTIELISIGLISLRDRRYYAISNEFDIKAAWNSSQLEVNKNFPAGPEYNKVYWLRENVLKPIFEELATECAQDKKMSHNFITAEFNFKNFKKLINHYGKSRETIAKEIKEYVQSYAFDDVWEQGHRFDSVFGNGINNTFYFIKDGVKSEVFVGTSKSEDAPEFYAYYADYDWVVLCQLFGKMMDLPKGYPMYCKDLKQLLDDKLERSQWTLHSDFENREPLAPDGPTRILTFDEKLKKAKSSEAYPVNTKEHNALDDAVWNRELFHFINHRI